MVEEAVFGEKGLNFVLKALRVYLSTGISLLVVILIIAYNMVGGKFDRNKWNDKNDWDYPYRDAMADDLMKHHKLKGLSFKQLKDLLGAPENFTDADSIYYQLIMDYGWDIDPVHTKYLVFKLNKDSVVTGFRINEWERGN